MNKIKKILAPTDLSELSLAGVHCALDLAGTTGAEVTVYHAVSTEELMRYGRQGVLHDFLEKFESGLRRFVETHCADRLSDKVHTKVALGSADINIVEEAAKEGVDLIVISTHGRTGLAHVLVGSVTEKVVRHAPCPVLSIHPADVKAAKKNAA